MRKCLYGASGHAKVVVDIIKSNEEEVFCIIDDNPKWKVVSNILVQRVDEYQFENSNKFIISIGNNSIRKKIVIKNNFNYFTSAHEKAFISPSSEIGEGTVVMANAIINAEAKIGKHCIINSGAIVEHDCELSDFVHISPNASLAGNVIVGEGAHIGIGACIIQGIKVGKWATIGAGSVIIKDIPDYGVVVGNPGKIIKNNIVEW